MKILLVSSEVKPFSVSGGLGDVSSVLPQKIKKLGHDIRIITPMYRGILEKYEHELTICGAFDIEFGYGKIPLLIYSLKYKNVIHYFVRSDYHFNREQFYNYNDDYVRFALFSKVSIDILEKLEFKPDIIHCNDWQTGLLPVYLDKNYKHNNFYKDIKILFTIHNLQYQGIFESRVLEEINLEESYLVSDKIEFFGNINYLKAGLVYADYLSTVSERYSKEIQTEEYGFGLAGVMREHRHKLTGIVNGIEYSTNDPKTDDISVNFDKKSIYKKQEGKIILKSKLGLSNKDVPLVVLISRLAYQKGIHLIPNVIEDLGIQLVVLGTGESRYEDKIKMIQNENRGNVKAIFDFDEKIANELYAYGDLFLMPSLFEPCGLGQLYAMRYGTVPIVRNTGGLRDTVKQFNEDTLEGTGIIFNDCLEDAVIWGIKEGVRLYKDKEKWNKLITNCMEQDFSWDESAKKYCELYEKLIKL